jgi:ribonuclease J
MHFDLAQGDTVVISSRTIPGNDLPVFGVIGQLIRRGVQLHTWISDREIHVSGHAHRQEQKRMLELVRPKAFIPVHGTLHHLTRHAALAREVGVSQTCVIENGDVATLDEAGLRKTGKVNVGRVACAYGRAIGAPQLRERVIMAGEGVVVVTVVRRSAAPADVLVTTRGTVESHDEVVDAARRAALEALEGPGDVEPAERVRLAVRHVFREAIGFKPVTIVTIVEAST